MRYPYILLAGAWLTASAAIAQTQVVPSDDWTLHTATTPSLDHQNALPGVPGVARTSPFRFSDGDGGGLLSRPPPRPTDRDAVLGTGRAWLGGRPPLDCAVTPHDARCH